LYGLLSLTGTSNVQDDLTETFRRLFVDFEETMSRLFIH